MKSLMLSTALVAMISSGAFAGSADVGGEDPSIFAPARNTGPVIGGSVEVEVAKNDVGDYAATATFGVGISVEDLVFGEASVESVNGETFEINKWVIGTTLGDTLVLSFGNHDGGLFVTSYSDYSTIAAPEMNEAIMVGAAGATLAVGFTDITEDITDVSNLQASYELGVGPATVKVAADYNIDGDDYAVGLATHGVELFGVGLGSTLSYASATELVAYEMDATVFGVTAYVNGDSDDSLRNVGAGYGYQIGRVELGADLNYDLNDEEFSPRAMVSFNF